MKYSDVYRMKKIAGKSNIYSDIAGSVVTGMIPSIGGPANLGGMAAAYINPMEKDEPYSMKDLIPGRMNYRAHSKVINSAKKNNVESPRATVLSEQLGGLPAALLLLGLGGAIGAGAGALTPKGHDMNAITGTVLGAAGGAGVFAGAELGAMALAALRRTRTNAEQQAVDADPNAIVKNMVLPGRGSYNLYKRIGNIRANEKAAENKKNK